ncbi:hypothetical protein D3C86_1801950 [compost metagenome]
MLPQVAFGGCTPKPRKLSEDSIIMAEAMLFVAPTIVTGIRPGKICRQMMPEALWPEALAYSTYSRSLIVSVSARMTRATLIHISRAIIMMILPTLGFRNTLSSSRIRKEGIDMIISSIRISRLSSQPPK